MSSSIRYFNPLDDEKNKDTRTAHAIDLIRTLPGFLGLGFNPKTLVKGVNYLQGIDYDESIKALRNYCALAQQDAVENNPENVRLVARILFVPKDLKEELPPLLLGQPDLEEPKDRTLLPLFPIVIHRDIPFLLISGYRAGGEARPSWEYVDWCIRHCEIRSTPLIPNNNPLASVDEFLESGIWKELNPDYWHYFMLRLQALRAVSNVYPISKQDEREILSTVSAERIWNKHREKFESLNVLWNVVTNEYEIRENMT
jgi:hypothetical protein